jgi:hypothetical protein
MSYKSYKQLYRIILKSTDCTTANKTVSGTATIATVANIDIVQKYFFPLHIELPFTTQARLAVKSFSNNNFINNDEGYPFSIGAVYSPTLSTRNTYQLSNNSKGVHLFSHHFNTSSTPNIYENKDIEFDYIDIQNNTSWLTNGIEIAIDSKIKTDAGAEISGFPNNGNWCLELIIYDSVLEKNPDFVPSRPLNNYQFLSDN